MADDKRKEFVLSAVLDAVSTAESRDAFFMQLAADADGAMRAFLEDESTMVFQATVSGGAVRSSNVVSFDTASTCQVVLTKLRAGALQLADIPANVAVTSMSHSPVSALYHQLHSIYGPLLSRGGEDATLKGLVAELEAGRGSVLRLTGGAPPAAGSGVPDPAAAPLVGILSPLDECKLWGEVAFATDASVGLRRCANEVYRALEPMKQCFEALPELPDEEVLELVDTVSDCLDNAWKLHGESGPSGAAVFPQRRVEHLMRLVGSSLVGHVQTKLRRVRVWTDPFKAVEGALRFGHRCLAKWEKSAAELSAINWAEPGGGAQVWRGPPYADAALGRARARLDEVFKMRETQAELAKLLTPEEARALTLSEVFGPFAGVDPLQVSDYTAPLWDAACSDYDQRMRPVEERLSEKLREHLLDRLLPSLLKAVNAKTSDDRAAATAQPHQVLREVARYAELLRRPTMARALAGERRQLGESLERFMNNIKAECDQRANALLLGQQAGDSGARAGRNTTEVVEAVVWAVQALERVALATEVCGALVMVTHDKAGNRLEGVEQDKAGDAGAELTKESKELLREILALKKQLFDEWQEGIVHRLGHFKLDLGSKLMDLNMDAGSSSSSAGHVKLHYNSELVSLLREVRQLSALGFTVRRDIATEAETARKFYRHGMVLRQVANFYNNIASEMIPCQKPMMLEDAVRFEKVLTNPKDGLGKVITWNNPSALEKYISTLQGVASTLTDKNRRLRKWHRTLADKVSALFAMDLVRQKEAWKRAVKELRGIFASLEGEFRKDLQSAWRVHWDHQLYKALEYQYHRGLETLNEMLPTAAVSLVFKQRRLQFDPPLEEMRTAHYKQVRDFLNLPLVFKGVSDASEKPGFFRGMADSPVGAEGCAGVYEKTEALFAKLADEQKKYSEWVALGTVDLDAFVEEHLSESQHFEEGFKLVKSASKQAERIPAEVKVDCYVVSCQPLKSAVEKHIKELQDVLSTCLQRKVVRHKEEMEKFVVSGKTLLDTNAQTVEEIGNMRSEAKIIMADFGGRMTQMRRQAADLAKLLKQSGGSGPQAAGPVDFSSLDSEWENLSTKLVQLETHLETQKENLKGQIASKITEFTSKAEAFRDRWLEFKPRGMPQGDPSLIITKLEDDFLALEELREEANKVRQDCEHFSMERPALEVLDELAEDIKATREAWKRFDDFMTERTELTGRDWIAIRGKLYELDDFLAKWTEKVRAIEKKDAVAVLLLEQIEGYKRCIPALKFCRGEGWEDSHWAQLFSLLRFPIKGPDAVSRHNLTLQHFLDKADVLAEKSEALQTLHAQAAGEVTLREALYQLKVWGLDRRFALVTQAVAGPKGGSIALIKEWKEILTEVGDNQSLVSSLKDSPFFAPFKEETSVWEAMLATLADRLTHVNAIQRKWLYLQPIFARGALPQEQQRFRRVDEDFQSMMGLVSADSLVKTFADHRMRANHLDEMSTQLDMCQKALAAFLEEKRSMLPRFYFIGDDDLLEILGQAKNPEVIQAHLKKLFAGIHSVVFAEGNASITAMKSIAGEVVPLQEPVAVSEAVEAWLADLAAGMVSSLQGMLVKCLDEKDYEAFPSQILGLADQVHFAKDVEKAVTAAGLSAAAQASRAAERVHLVRRRGQAGDAAQGAEPGAGPHPLYRRGGAAAARQVLQRGGLGVAAPTALL
jgi:dynein heavy chain 2